MLEHTWVATLCVCVSLNRHPSTTNITVHFPSLSWLSATLQCVNPPAPARSLALLDPIATDPTGD